MGISFRGINIMAKDPAATFEFYKGIGLEVKEEVADPNDQWYGAEFALPGGAVLWIWRDHDDIPKPGALPIAIVLVCEDIEADYLRLKEMGYAVGPPERMFYGGREMHLKDPDGNQILFLD